MNTREVLCTLLDATAFVDAVMARAFADAPDVAFAEQLRGEALRQAIGMLDMGQTLSAKLDVAVSQACELGLDGMRSEFENAFFGIPTKIHPYESVFESEEKMLFQPHTLEVRKAYRAQGFEAPLHAQFPDDSLALELEFLQKVLASASEALSAGDAAACFDLINAALTFLDEHLGLWVAEFVSSFEATRFEGGFYHRLSQLMADLVVQEKAMLRQIFSERDSYCSE